MIIPLKKAHIVVLKEDKEKLLKNLQKNEVLMLISSGEDIITYDANQEETLLSRAENSLKLINNYRKKQGFVREEVIVSYDAFMQDNPRRKELIDLIEDKSSLVDQINSENESLQNDINFYKPWESLDIKLSDLDNVKYAKIHAGMIENRSIDMVINLLKEYQLEYQILSSANSETAIIYASYIDDDKVILDKVKSLGFNEISFINIDKNVSDLLLEKENKMSENLEKISALKEDLSKLAEEYDQIELLKDQVSSFKELKTAPVTETYTTVYLVGWVRNDQVDKLEKVVKDTTDVYELELSDPEEDDVVPTMTKNNKFVSAFEPITNMFSIPSVNDVDPNPVMGLWYWIIFGMMMGDAGYGIVLAIAMFVLIKAKKPKGSTLKLYRMLFYGSFTTIIWGVLFNSFFGYPILEKAILLDPTKDILKYLYISLIVGGLHLISGYLIKAYSNIRAGRLLDAIFDNFAWIFLIVGIGFLFLPGVLNKVGIALAITGALIIVFTHGRSNKNVFAKLGGGLYSLYNSVGVFSDILSYSRILALSLSSAIIGMVMNILAEMLQGNAIGIFFSIIVYIVGHIFNLVMGLLSAYVHDSRLQYIEFFGKFYEGGGVEFKPLSLNLKYVDKIKKDEI